MLKYLSNKWTVRMMNKTRNSYLGMQYRKE